MSDKKKSLPDGVTDEQVQALVRRHGKVYPVRVAVDNQEYVGLFRKPTLADMSAASSLAATDPIGSNRLVYNSCKLVADKGMDENEEVLVAAMSKVAGLFRILQAEVGEPFGAGA